MELSASCKLHYLRFKFTKHRISRLQMFFRAGVLKNLATFAGKHMCWSLRTYPVAASGTLMNSFFIAFENDEWCHFVVCFGIPVLISFYCLCFVFFHFFLFFYLFFWWIRLLADVLRKICQHLGYSSGVVPRFPSGVSRGTLLQPYLAFNVTGVVQYGKNFRYVLPPLAS